MLRIKIPGGRLTPAQLRTIGDVLESHSQHETRARHHPAGHPDPLRAAGEDARRRCGPRARRPHHARGLRQHHPQRDRLSAGRRVLARAHRRQPSSADRGAPLPAQSAQPADAAQVQGQLLGLRVRLRAGHDPRSGHRGGRRDGDARSASRSWPAAASGTSRTKPSWSNPSSKSTICSSRWRRWSRCTTSTRTAPSAPSRASSSWSIASAPRASSSAIAKSSRASRKPTASASFPPENGATTPAGQCPGSGRAAPRFRAKAIRLCRYCRWHCRSAISPRRSCAASPTIAEDHGLTDLRTTQDQNLIFLERAR